MASKGKKVAPTGAKGKKAPGFTKSERAPVGGGSAVPLAVFEDDDMYQEPIKKVRRYFRTRETLLILGWKALTP